MDISVVIPVYNSEKLIEECVLSMLHQDFTGSYEIIIVDDCSTDKTPRLLEKLAAQADGKITLLRTPVNSGYPTAMNLAINAAKGKYIARQDSDDMSHPSRLSVQYKIHEEHPDAAFVSCTRYWLTVHGKPFYAYSSDVSPYFQETWENIIGQNRKFTDPACMFLRERALLVGGYNTYQRSGMDVDMWLRLIELAGKPMITVNKPVYARRLIPNSLIYQPKTTYSNSLPRLFAKYRVKHQLPPYTIPQSDWIVKTRKEIPPAKGEFQKVRLIMDTALINLQMWDIAGFFSFFRIAMARNPVSALRFLAGAVIRRKLSDRIAGIPAISND